MKKFIFVAGIVLFILHQDIWWWDKAEPLVFGFIPIGLAYHSFYTILAACLWALAIRFAWPHHLEEFAEAEEEPPTS